MRHFHLDPVGGVAGDMFVGALLDLRPGLAADAIAAVRAAGLAEEVELAHLPWSDGILSGSRFAVNKSGTAPALPNHGPAEHPHAHPAVPTHSHHHGAAGTAGQAAAAQSHAGHSVRWAALRQRLRDSALNAAVCERALDIFARLAAAEARVHAVAVDSVAFHEVGAWDSIADIVASAFLIERLAPCTWSIGALPIGRGRVRSAHGLLPVPAPATALLLEGCACFDDGLPGERVTPTGAAILNHLAPASGLGTTPRRLLGSAHGFGTRRFEGLSNVLRVLEFDAAIAAGPERDEVVEIRFEIDDQTAEDLAVALDHLRALDGVLDVSQCPITGKQGRLAAAIQVLVRPAASEAVSTACFRETTTLGLRLQRVERRVLARRAARSADGLRVKIAERGASRTAKTDIADVAALPDQAARSERRTTAAREALDEDRHEP